MRLQLLESELMMTCQQEFSIKQYFTKVNSLCREISKLDLFANINEQHMRRIIISVLRLEYRCFITTIQGWPTQSSLEELENLLHQLSN